jgi:hypothetical protein
MFGVPGVRVLATGEVDGELHLLVESDPTDSATSTTTDHACSWPPTAGPTTDAASRDPMTTLSGEAPVNVGGGAAVLQRGRPPR